MKWQMEISTKDRYIDNQKQIIQDLQFKVGQIEKDNSYYKQKNSELERMVNQK